MHAKASGEEVLHLLSLRTFLFALSFSLEVYFAANLSFSLSLVLSIFALFTLITPPPASLTAQPTRHGLSLQTPLTPEKALSR